MAAIMKVHGTQCSTLFSQCHLEVEGQVDQIIKQNTINLTEELLTCFVIMVRIACATTDFGQKTKCFGKKFLFRNGVPK